MAERKKWLPQTEEELTPFQLAMMALSLLSVIVVLVLSFAKLEPETKRLLTAVDFSICIIFLTYFFYGLARADDKVYYIKHNWIDFVASIPVIEPLRFARLFQILRVIRLIRMAQSFIVPMVKQRRQATLASLLVAMVTILTFSSVLILIVESGVPDANIQTAENAIWWALVTISTVGYGDYYPVTTAGHVIGGIVIICGVSFFGVISGYMASLFIAPDESEKIEAQSKEIRTELHDALERMEANQGMLLKQIDELQQELKQERSSSGKSS
ncbi:ion transporter [Shewanella woodyi]|uniref:Ion transport 2 domain protein n=1 Tax=Shewanella woodyi (strain ATCC 51908 / MS32) TaxID=392500 RepID=B1KE28_SHEWM|nr:ion transporter [Shewanella woodyi]ACA85014.1 Ion transport 2 domain protein [Shewanella woodyi ATCC 51908]